MSVDNKEFGLYLRRLRERAGFSLREAGSRIGVSNTYLHQIETGDRNPPVTEKLYAIADAFGVSRSEMLTAAGRQTAPARVRTADDDLEAAYQLVINHSKFKYGHQSRSAEMTPEAKRVIVRMFEELTGLRVLEED